MIQLFFALFLNTQAPPCQDFEGNILPVNNAQVLYWKSNTPNQYLDRGHIYGRVGTVYPDKNGHKHFQAIIDGGTIEIVYNDSFGSPVIKTGDVVESCGDYITSNKATAKYPPSPDKAILHWVHRSNNPNNHPHGYLRINEINY